MSEFTPKYNLEKPSQDDFYDVDVHNKNMERIEEQLSLNEEAVKNMDVSASITNVINERVNADTSKPLSTLISEWVNAAKTAILNAVSTLTTHVTSQHTATKNHVTTKVDALPQKSVWTDVRGAKLDMLDQGIIKTQSNINGYIVTARDNIKSHMTSLMASPKVVKSIQRGITDTGVDNVNITISAVDLKKSILIVQGSYGGGGTYSSYSGGSFISSTQITVGSGRTPTHWQVIEFY